MIFLAVAVAGALGAVTRYALSGLVQRWTGNLPLGTFTVNVLGCFAIGLLAGWFGSRWSPDPMLRAAVIGGFLGAFTTFSALAVEAIRLPTRRSLAYLLVSVAGGLAGAGIGLALMSI